MPKNQIVVIESEGVEVVEPSDEAKDFIERMGEIARSNQARFLAPPNARATRKLEGEVAHTAVTIFDLLASYGESLKDEE